MQLFKKETRINFMGRRRPAALASVILLALAIAILALRGLNFGIDFTGGTVVEVGYGQAADLSEVRSALAENGFDDAVVQNFGSAREVLIRLGPREGVAPAQVSTQLLEVLRQQDPTVDMRRVEFVGPQVGEELTQDGMLAMLYALGGILIYVAFRFEYRFAAGSVAALLHDLILVLGLISLFNISFDLTVLAALLAVVGYSLNDTIVVFDRIRENFLTMRHGSTEQVMNSSINQTLSRTIITSFTTLLVVISLYVLGGELIAGFAFTLLVGILVGTYSSIFVASSSALSLGVSKYDLQPPAKEGAEEDSEQRP